MMTLDQKVCYVCGDSFHVELGSSLIVCPECRKNPEQVLNYSNEPPRFVADAMRRSMPEFRNIIDQAIRRAIDRRAKQPLTRTLKNDQ